MAFAVKTAVQVQAWELGAGSGMEKEMIRRGKIVPHPDGTFELFSQETTEGKGQSAMPGDYFKVDDRGCLHPNKRAFFLQNHRHIEGDWYLQSARPLKIWRLGDPECEELRFLLDRGLLSIHPEDKKRCFSAQLWDTTETAPADAVIIFYQIDKDPEGRISAVDFNFVESGYFSSNYKVLSE